MEKNLLIKIVVVLLSIILILLLAIYQLFFNINFLQKGEQMDRITSPDGTYSINIYLVNSHATVSCSIRGELENNETGKRKNIYWEYKIDQAKVTWKSSKLVKINEQIIEIPNGKYDFRIKNR